MALRADDGENLPSIHYSTNQAAALEYARRGWMIFPLYEMDADGGCTCSTARSGKPCSSSGKHPRTPNGLTDATADEAAIRAWWHQWPQSNIGIATGATSGLVVIDVDPRHDGLDGLRVVETALGQLPQTLTAHTGGDGWHRFYQHPGGEIRIPNAAGGKGRMKEYPGVDVRGDGGYVVAAPSNHHSGGCYEWEIRAEVAPLPLAYIDLLAEKPAKKMQPGPAKDTTPFIIFGDAGQRLLQKYLHMARDGSRNDTGLDLACQLRDARLSEQEAERIMMEYAARVAPGDEPYTEREALASLRQAYSRPPREMARSESRRAWEDAPPPDDAFFHAGDDDIPPPPPSAEEDTPSAEDAADGDDTEDGKKEKKFNQARALIKICEMATFFRTPTGALYASIPLRGHREIWPLDEKGGFRLWLSKAYYRIHGSPPNTTALGQAIDWCRGEAQFLTEVRQVYTRIAEHEGRIYIDLCDEKWRAIEITGDGWGIVDMPPVAFIRPQGALPLIEPVKGGDLNELRKLLNIESDQDWTLIVAWLIGAFHPRGPYPVLDLIGEQGTSKSTATRLLRALIDPSAAPARSAPKDERDLAIAAKNNWVLALENLSHMPAWLSDALCRLSTGGGFATRKLYTDDGETIFDAKRPSILNGIEAVVTRGDLGDRTICVALPVIPEKARMAENIIERRFYGAAPGILGALLDAVSAALRNVDAVKLDKLPRMADFAQWVVAAESALGWKRGTFLAAYSANREQAVGREIEASPLAQAMRAFMEDYCTRRGVLHWQGSATDLHKELNHYREQEGDLTQIRGWPTNSQKLSGQLSRLAPALRTIGLEMETRRTRMGSEITMRMIPVEASSGVTHGDATEAGGDASVTQDFSDASPVHPASEAEKEGSVTHVTQDLPPSSVEENKEERKGAIGKDAIEQPRDLASHASHASHKPPIRPDVAPESAAMAAPADADARPHMQPDHPFAVRVKVYRRKGLSEDAAIQAVLAEKNERCTNPHCKAPFSGFHELPYGALADDMMDVCNNCFTPRGQKPRQGRK